MNHQTNIESQFWDLIQTANKLDAEASRILDDDSAQPVDSNRMVEPTYVAICDLVVEHPEERQCFVNCFTELIQQKRKSPWMLVPFCMRVLRMPEIRLALHEEMDRRGRETDDYVQMMNYCSTVMHAYLDEIWEYEFAFDTFQK